MTERERVAPIGFNIDEPDYLYHGESMHPDAIPGQCMCGHPDFWECMIERLYEQ